MRVYRRFLCISGLSSKEVASVIFRQFLKCNPSEESRWSPISNYSQKASLTNSWKGFEIQGSHYRFSVLELLEMQISAESSMTVKGPSLIRLTSIAAPKLPSSTISISSLHFSMI